MKAVIWWLATVMAAGLLPVFSASTNQDKLDSAATLIYNREYERAEVLVMDLLKKKPNSIKVHRTLQELKKSQGKKQLGALCRFYRSTADTNGSALMHYLAGRCLGCKEGLPYLEKSLKVNAKFKWNSLAVGACEFEAKNYQKASERFKEIIKNNPHFYEAYQDLAKVYSALKERKKVRKVYKKLIGLSRDRSQPYIWQGNWYSEEKNWKQAIKSYEKASLEKRADPELYFKLGYFYFSEGHFHKAIDNYEKSIKLGNKRDDVYFNLASSQEQIKLYEKALENYQVAWEKGDHKDALYSMGGCAVKLGLYTKAIKSYSEYLKLDNGNTEALFGLANAWQIKKDFKKAVTTYKKIISIDESYSKAYYNLGSIYAYHTPDRQKMKKYWDLFIEKSQDPDEIKFIKNELNKYVSKE